MNALISQLINFSPGIMATVGGYNIHTGDAAAEVGNLNSIFIKAGVAVGIILLVVGVLKLIMALADENPKGKMDASIFLGIGAFFLGMTTVVNTLKVSNTSTVQSVTSNILSIISDLCGYAGVVLLAVTVLLLIFAISQEQPEAMAKTSTTAGVAIGLLSTKALVQMVINMGILGNITTGDDASMSLVSVVVVFLSTCVGYVAITLVPLGVFKLIYSFRTEDAEGRNSALKIIVVGVACSSFRIILRFFGI